MSEELVFWGSVFSIIGVCVTVFLTIYVIKLGKKQREIDEQYYRHQTLTNIRSISQNIINYITISMEASKTGGIRKWKRKHQNRR